MSAREAGARGWLGLAALAVMWGSAFAFTTSAVETVPPGGVAFGRLVLGAGILAIYALARGRRFPPLADYRWRWFLALGLFGNAAPFYLIAAGQQHVASAVAGILLGAMPLATIAIAHFAIPGDRLTLSKSLGFLTGFAGVVILMGPPALAGLGTDLLAQLMILAGGVCYAINAILAQRAPRMAPSLSAAGMLIGAAVLAAPMGIWELSRIEAAPDAWAIAAVAWLGVVPTAIAAIIYMEIARSIGASFIAQVNYLVPLVAAFVGVVLGEALTLTTFLALAVILLGLAIARRGSRPRPAARHD